MRSALVPIHGSRSRASTPAWIALAMLGALASGCPRTTPPPERMGGMPCETHADCNPGVECGEQAVCVTGICESGQSLVVPCPGVGERVP